MYIFLASGKEWHNFIGNVYISKIIEQIGPLTAFVCYLQVV
jgi:hypothetical protein